jgi:hypothetical protein
MVIAAIPISIAARSLGGKTGIFKTIFAHLIFAVLLAVIQNIFGKISTILTYILLVIVYKYAFRMGWLGAMLVLVLAILIVALFMFLFALVGIALL